MINNIGMHIKVSDFVKSKAFYDALGFKKVFEYGPDKKFVKNKQGQLISAPEAYHGVTYQVGDARLEIADGHRAVKPEVFKEKISSSKTSLMVNVDSIGKLIKRCGKAKIPLTVGPRHFYWGTLEVVIKDPDGLVLVFIAPYSARVAKQIHADETFGQPPKK